MPEIGVTGGQRHRALALRRAGKNRQHVAAAGGGQRADRRDLLRLRTIGAEERGGLRQLQCGFHLRICLLRQGLVDRRQGACIARLEHGLRGLEALPDRDWPARFRRRRLDGAAQGVVDADLADLTCSSGYPALAPVTGSVSANPPASSATMKTFWSDLRT